MRRFAVAFLLAALPAAAQELPAGTGPPSGLRQVIESHLGRPYSWGASGLKSFDCSGFVWRVMLENGVLIKRTTARKLYLALPRAPEGHEHEFGNLVFFDNLGHCGIVNGPEGFYHSQCSRGTNLSSFEPYWRRLVCGYRAMPMPAEKADPASSPRPPT